MSASAGKVLGRICGVYDPNATYTILDQVKFGVSTYILKVPTATGIIPTNTDYWQISAEGVSNVSPEALGIGYGVSSDSGSARTATLADYNLTPNGIVAVTFAADVLANATLNINSQGAKAIYYRGSAIVANVIRGGDTVTFAYDGTHYDILCIDSGAGHKIINSAGTELTQRTNLQFTGTGVSVTDDSAGDKTVVEITDKGHTIKDSGGTAMTAQPNLQFADANVSNDGTNNATVIHNFVDIDWDDWQEVDDNDNTYYRVTDAPLVDGNVEIDLMKKLWENSAPTASFAAQNITLASDDYDFLMIVYAYYAESLSTMRQFALWLPKGYSTNLTSNGTSNSGAAALSRAMTRNSDTSFSVGICYQAIGTSAQTTRTDALVPLAIYGIKQKVSISLSAIISNVSTSASKCMLSDGETSVEDALTKQTLTFDVTISANSSIVKTESVTGAFAIVGIYSSVGYTEICSFRANSNQIYVSLRNPSNVSISPTITVDYLAMS